MYSTVQYNTVHHCGPLALIAFYDEIGSMGFVFQVQVVSARF